MTDPNNFIFNPDFTCFPNNAVIAIRDSIQQIDPDLYVTTRRLRPSDPNEAAGVWPSQWRPQEDSYEMRGPLVASSEPTLQRYIIGVECSVKDADEARGLIRHAAFAKTVRGILYRDPTLAVSLRALSVSLLGETERTGRWGISNQRYLSNEIEGSWIYLSTLEFWIETETGP
jgi:hypothetical protein